MAKEAWCGAEYFPLNKTFWKMQTMMNKSKGKKNDLVKNMGENIEQAAEDLKKPSETHMKKYGQTKDFADSQRRLVNQCRVAACWGIYWGNLSVDRQIFQLTNANTHKNLLTEYKSNHTKGEKKKQKTKRLCKCNQTPYPTQTPHNPQEGRRPELRETSR